jgi:hypothetical protein
MAFDLSTATPVDTTSAEGSSLLPGANEFPEIKKRAKQYKETEAERTAAVPTPNLAESAKLVPGVASDAASQVGNLGQGAFNYMKENPLAVPEAYLAYKGSQAIYKNLKEKFFGKQPTAAPESELFAKVEPDLNVSNKPVVNEPMLDMATEPAPTQVKETVNPVQAMKNKLLASDTKEQFIQRQFGPRYNANPTEPAFFPVKPEVPPIGPETPPVTPETPSVPETPPAPEAPTTKTNAPSSAPKEAKIAPVVPPEMRPNPIKNKVKDEVIGRGAYNWVAGQVGPNAAPKVWEAMVGSRNIPYDPKVLPKMYEDYKLATMAGGEPGVFPDTSGSVNEKGGAYPRPKFVPEYIKGAATPSALATTAVMTALPALGVAAYQKYKGNEAAVDASIQDAKDSLKSLATMPYDVSKAALKGDFGPLKDLMLSMNPGSLLFNEMNKKDEEIIKKMIQKEKVGAGRGVAPPTR